MYFVPILLALMIYLAYPSMVIAGSVAGLAWLYLAFAGARPRREQLAHIRRDLAYRTLSVKALAITGGYDQTTYDVHAINTPDEPENSALRAKLRDAAAASRDGWKQAARRLRKETRRDQRMLLDHLSGIVIQLTSQPGARVAGSRHYRLDDEVQDFLVDLGRVWGIGPRNVREVLVRNDVMPSLKMANL